MQLGITLFTQNKNAMLYGRCKFPNSLPLPYSQIPKSERKTKQNRRNTRPHATHLSGSSESLGELADVLLELAVAGQELDVSTVGLNLTSLTLGDVLLALERGETPVLGDDDLLATREPVRISLEPIST